MKKLLFLALAAASVAASAATPAETAALDAAKQIYAIKGGDLGTFFQALPASYQTGVADVVKLFATKIDANLWTGAQGALKDVAGAALMKSEFALENVPEENRSGVIRMIAKAAAAVKSASYDDLKSGNIAKILAAKPLEMPGVTDKLPAFKIPEITVKQNDDGTVAVTADGETEDFALVEGKWIPKDLADGFLEGIQEAKSGLASFEIPAQMKPQLAMVFPMISNTAKKAAKAATKEEFTQTVMTGLVPLALMANSFGGGMGGATEEDEDEEVEYDMAE